MLNKSSVTYTGRICYLGSPKPDEITVGSPAFSEKGANWLLFLCEKDNKAVILTGRSFTEPHLFLPLRQFPNTELIETLTKQIKTVKPTAAIIVTPGEISVFDESDIATSI